MTATLPQNSGEFIGKSVLSGTDVYRDELVNFTHEWLRIQTQVHYARQRATTLAQIETWIERALGVNMSNGTRVFSTTATTRPHPHAALRKNA